jgi:hypothetical protein
MIKNHRGKNDNHFESKARLRSENYGGKTVGVKSWQTEIERPMIVAVDFIFVRVVKGKEGVEDNKARRYDKFRKEMSDPTQDRDGDQRCAVYGS